jgi:hypothetical protein
MHQNFLAAALLVAGSALAAQTPSPTPSLVERQDQLAGRFRPLAARAIAPSATRADREALVKFLRAEVVPYMADAGATVYPVVDNIMGSEGYVTIAASLDQDAIIRTVKDLAVEADAKDPTKFVGQAYAVSALLDTYFQREALLIVPVLHRGLSGRDVARAGK